MWVNGRPWWPGGGVQDGSQPAGCPLHMWFLSLEPRGQPLALGACGLGSPSMLGQGPRGICFLSPWPSLSAMLSGPSPFTFGGLCLF